MHRSGIAARHRVLITLLLGELHPVRASVVEVIIPHLIQRRRRARGAADGRPHRRAGGGGDRHGERAVDAGLFELPGHHRGGERVPEMALDCGVGRRRDVEVVLCDQCRAVVADDRAAQDGQVLTGGERHARERHAMLGDQTATGVGELAGVQCQVVGRGDEPGGVVQGAGDQVDGRLTANAARAARAAGGGVGQDLAVVSMASAPVA